MMVVSYMIAVVALVALSAFVLAFGLFLVNYALDIVPGATFKDYVALAVGTNITLGALGSAWRASATAR